MIIDFTKTYTLLQIHNKFKNCPFCGKNNLFRSLEESAYCLKCNSSFYLDKALIAGTSGSGKIKLNKKQISIYLNINFKYKLYLSTEGIYVYTYDPIFEDENFFKISDDNIINTDNIPKYIEKANKYLLLI